MPKFPLSMADILGLARKIVGGIVDNPGDYPNPPFDVTLLESLLEEAIQDIAHEQEMKAGVKAAGEKRRGTMKAMAKEMRHLLAQAQIAHGQDAGKLEKIGWDKRAHPKSLMPGQVRNLWVLHQGMGNVDLDWQAPEVTAHTGKVSVYIISRTIRDENTRETLEESGVWSFASYKSKAHLENQPRGVEIEYRVVATNVNGEGPPSNTELVVL